MGTPPIPPRRTYTIPAPTTTTTTPPPLPRRLSVDEAEWSVTPSRNPVGTGQVELNVNNLGEDDHDLTVERADGTRVAQTAVIPPGGDATLTATLPPGTYKLYCSLYGNHEHDRLGMHAELVVK